jgi:hypothetical protein
MRGLILLILIAGCIQPGIEKQIILDYALGGYTGKANEGFFVIPGGVQNVKKELFEIVVERASPRSTFSTQEKLNLVIFRGVFSTGGHGIEVEKVERKRNNFYVYSVYTDPSPNMMVTQAFTQPTAIIPIGKLGKGEYRATLLVTLIVKKEEGDVIIYKEKEKDTVEFSVK